MLPSPTPEEIRRLKTEALGLMRTGSMGDAFSRHKLALQVSRRYVLETAHYVHERHWGKSSALSAEKLFYDIRVWPDTAKTVELRATQGITGDVGAITYEGVSPEDFPARQASLGWARGLMVNISAEDWPDWLSEAAEDLEILTL